MVDVGGLFARGIEVAADYPRLAAVPVVTALLAVDNVRRVAGFRGTHGGVSFTVPAAVLDVWSFVSVPNQGISGPDAVPLALLPLFAVANGVLAAGYLACIRNALRDDDLAFLDGVRRHGPALIGYQLLTLAALFLLVSPAMASPVLLVVVVPVVTVAAYLFYGAPYLVVADDRSLVASLGDSYRLAVDRGPYARFFLAVLVGGAIVSLVATPMVVNLGLVGVLLGTVAFAPVGVAVNAATMALFLTLVGDDDTGDAPGPGDGSIPSPDDGPEPNTEPERVVDPPSDGSVEQDSETEDDGQQSDEQTRDPPD